MNTSSKDPASTPHNWMMSGSDIRAAANGLLALVAEFEAEIGKGCVLPAVDEPLAQLRRTAEGLIDQSFR